MEEHNDLVEIETTLDSETATPENDEQEIMHLSQLNALAKEHGDEAYQKKQKEEYRRRMAREAADKRKARRTAYNRATLKFLLFCIAVAAFAGCGYYFDLIHPSLALPIALASLLIGSERLGEWRGKHRNKEGQ
jgi:hypothetical protein